MKICFPCTPGGHLALLVQLRPWWLEHDRFWVCVDRDDTRSLLAGERMVQPFHPTARNARNAIRNFVLAVRCLRRERPDVVVSAGAGIAVPFFVAARLLGIPAVFIEGFGRVDDPSLSGRLCYPLSSLFLVQWPEQMRYYARGRLVGTLHSLMVRDETPDVEAGA